MKINSSTQYHWKRSHSPVSHFFPESAPESTNIRTCTTPHNLSVVVFAPCSVKILRRPLSLTHYEIYVGSPVYMGSSTTSVFHSGLLRTRRMFFAARLHIFSRSRSLTFEPYWQSSTKKFFVVKFSCCSLLWCWERDFVVVVLRLHGVLSGASEMARK